MLLDGDAALAAAGRGGCCLDASFPVAILSSEVKKEGY